MIYNNQQARRTDSCPGSSGSSIGLKVVKREVALVLCCLPWTVYSSVSHPNVQALYLQNEAVGLDVLCQLQGLRDLWWGVCPPSEDQQASFISGTFSGEAALAAGVLSWANNTPCSAGVGFLIRPWWLIWKEAVHKPARLMFAGLSQQAGPTTQFTGSHTKEKRGPLVQKS